jgi:FkbM family methyltransferase
MFFFLTLPQRFVDPDANSADNRRRVFLDVGSHRGNFAFAVFSNWGAQDERDQAARLALVGEKAAPAHDDDVATRVNEPLVHAFEVSDRRVNTLVKLGELLPKGALHVHHLAVSDRHNVEVVVNDSPAGPSLGPGTPLDKVNSVTLDRWLPDHSIEHVALARIHANGFEPFVIRGMLESLRTGVVDQIIFDYSHKWKKEYTGRDADQLLEHVAQLLEEVNFECYMIAKHRLIKISDDYWVSRFELINSFKYISVDVWCVKHTHPQRRRILDFYNDPYIIEDPFD